MNNRNIAIVIAIIVIIILGYFMFSKKAVTAQNGSVVTVNYVGSLQNGTKFDASADHGGPLTLTLGPIGPNGEGYVIPGWEEGLIGMTVGEKKHLVIPPEKAYGDKQMGPIPPNSTLVFDVEMLDIQPAGPKPVEPHFPPAPALAQPETQGTTTTQ
ncbi:MAG: FKBP-type peptidyl-prolyl cis-trans isomerase [Candidatus Paceibacterota bacterium]|jgi:hypothetical protein